jgi:16S rRNA (cytosine1407-C5)-methyltransferase
LGTLHKNPEINNWWSEEYSMNLAERQFHLLRSAVRALRPGGELVYSTCTLTPWENEMVVDRALKEFPLELMEIPPLKGLKVHPGLSKFRGYTFHPDIKKCIRLNPNENRTEGFFVAKFRKTASMGLQPVSMEAHTFNWLTDKQSPAKKYVDFIAEEFGIERKLMRGFKYGMARRINFIRKEAADFPLYFKPERFGLPFCTPMERGAKLTTEAVHFWGPYVTKNIIRLDDIRELEKFVNREKPDIQTSSKGQKIIFYKELPIGYGYYDGKKLKSYFPRSEWPFRMSNI